MAPRIIKDRLMPNGQLDIRIPMAVTISFPANQSVAILVSRTLRKTAPIPLKTLPATASGNELLIPIRKPPKRHDKKCSNYHSFVTVSLAQHAPNIGKHDTR